MATLAQWIHVSAAVLGIGGMGFMLFVLIPSTRVLNGDQRDAFLRLVSGKFRWVTWSVIFLLIASGLYNVQLEWQAPWGTYWRFLTLKIALAVIVFIIALCLTIPLKMFDGFRRQRQLWLSIAFSFAMAVILISAYLRRG